VLGRVFPETLPWISGFKRHAGHTLSASGLIEASLLVEGLRRGMVPPWPGGIDLRSGFQQCLQRFPRFRERPFNSAKEWEAMSW